MTDDAANALSRLELVEYKAGLEFLRSRMPAAMAAHPNGGAAMLGAILDLACTASLTAYPHLSRTGHLTVLTKALGSAFDFAAGLQAGADADALMERIARERDA